MHNLLNRQKISALRAWVLEANATLLEKWKETGAFGINCNLAKMQ